MTIDELPDAAIRALLDHPRRIALVGASNKPDRPSFDVLAFLLEHDFDVTPVNPGLAGGRIHGRTVAASLAEAAPLDLVDIFRVAAQVGPVVDEAVQLGARTIWMQLGVVNQAAAESARRAGLTVVMNRCPKIEWYRLGL
jgi:predicted CoA-binding protein